MKNFPHVCFASFALATALTLSATPTFAGGWQCALQGSLAPTAEEEAVDKSLDIAVDLARHGLDLRGSAADVAVRLDFEHLFWSGLPNACQIQDILDAEVADLRARAEAFRANDKDVRLMEFHVVIGRYERMVANIQERWKAGGFADDLAEKALFTLRVQAFEYVSSLGLTDIRAQLQEAIMRLIQRGGDAMDRANALQETYVKVYTIRLEASLAVLQDRIQKGEATKQDFFRLNQIVAALEYLAAHPAPAPCGP